MAKTTYGQWNDAKRILHDIHKRVENNLAIASRRNGVFLRDKIKRTIRDQRSEWPPLKESTIARKGSSKALIHHGDLLLSINFQVVDARTIFIGVPKKTAKTKGKGSGSGESKVWNIGAIMEFGRQADPERGLPKIPARPYIGPTIQDNYDTLQETYVEAVDAAMKGKKYSVKSY